MFKTRKGVIIAGDRFLREGECRDRTGLSRSTRWRMEQRGTFPSRYQIGSNSIGWLESEVDEWLASRVIAGASA